MGRRPEHLLRRGTKSNLRVRVPDELRGVIGKGEIWRLLRTSDAAAARGLVRTERLKLEAEFDEARRAMKAAELASPRAKLSVLSEAEVWQLTARFFAARERQASEPLDPESVAIRTGELPYLEGFESAAQEVHGHVRAILAQASIPYPPEIVAPDGLPTIKRIDGAQFTRMSPTSRRRGSPSCTMASTPRWWKASGED